MTDGWGWGASSSARWALCGVGIQLPIIYWCLFMMCIVLRAQHGNTHTHMKGEGNTSVQLWSCEAAWVWTRQQGDELHKDVRVAAKLSREARNKKKINKWIHMKQIYKYGSTSHLTNQLVQSLIKNISDSSTWTHLAQIMCANSFMWFIIKSLGSRRAGFQHVHLWVISLTLHFMITLFGIWFMWVEIRSNYVCKHVYMVSFRDKEWT